MASVRHAVLQVGKYEPAALGCDAARSAHPQRFHEKAAPAIPASAKAQMIKLNNPAAATTSFAQTTTRLSLSA
jgi:hypothetical protein